MDLKELQNKIKNIKLGKEKIILLALAGLLLIASSCFEKGKEREETPRVSESIQENTEAGYQAQMERKIKRLLESVKKISDVTVVINLKSGSEKIVKEDSENTQSVKKSGSDSEKSSVLKKTTVVFNRSGDDEPYVIKEKYPEIEGVAVTGKGIDENKQEIINMLSALLGVPMHKISVLETD